MLFLSAPDLLCLFKLIVLLQYLLFGSIFLSVKCDQQRISSLFRYGTCCYQNLPTFYEECGWLRIESFSMNLWSSNHPSQTSKQIY